MSLDIEVLNQITETAVIASSVNTDKLKETDFPTAVISNDTRVISLENYQKNRNYFKGAFKTSDIDNFSEYNRNQDKYEDKQCFIDPEHMRAYSIFDIGNKECAGHCSHTATLSLSESVEYKALLRFDNEVISQKTISEFIEDWSENIACFYSESGELKPLENKIAIQLVRKVTIEAKSDKTSEVGDFETRQSVMESVEAKADGSVDKLPSRIVFKCKPYDVLQERTFIIRISMLTGDKSPRFSFRIINLGMHEKEMAEEFKNVLTNKLGDNIKTYIGNFCS